MLDPIALIQSLTLPAGALTGARIELDGTVGEIRVYDSNNHLRIRIANSGAGAVELFGGDSLEIVSGIIQEALSGAGGTRQLDLFLAPGIFQGGGRPTIDLLSSSQDGTVAERIQYVSPLHDFNPLGGGDIKFAGSRVLLHRGGVNHIVINGRDTILVPNGAKGAQITKAFPTSFGSGNPRVMLTPEYISDTNPYFMYLVGQPISTQFVARAVFTAAVGADTTIAFEWTAEGNL